MIKPSGRSGSAVWTCRFAAAKCVEMNNSPRQSQKQAFWASPLCRHGEAEFQRLSFVAEMAKEI